MAYKINGTTVVDNNRNVCACCVTSCCITASTRMDAPSGTTAQRPSSPATGSLYFDTDEGKLLSYTGSEWKAGGTEVNGIVGSEPCVSGRETPFLRFTESVSKVGCAGNAAAYSFGNSAPFADFSRAVPDCCAIRACLGSFGSFSNCCVTDNNNLPTVCRQFAQHSNTAGGVNVLNDGSHYTISRYTSTASTIPFFYSTCPNPDFHFSCLISSDGSHGELYWPVVTEGLCICCLPANPCFYCYDYRDIGFTHMHVPYSNGPAGLCELSFSSAYYVQPYCCFMAVMHSCDFGKTKFNFKYLTAKACSCLMFSGKCVGSMLPSMHSLHTCCIYNSNISLSPFSDPGFFSFLCSIGCDSSDFDYMICTKNLCVCPNFLSSKNMTKLCEYCTLCSACTYAANPKNGFAVCMHTNCTRDNFFGITWIVTTQRYCAYTSGCPCVSFMGVPTNKFFLAHTEFNPCNICCCLYKNDSGTDICYRYLPRLQIFDTQNHCHVGGVSYYGVCCDCPVSWTCHADRFTAAQEGTLYSARKYLHNQTDTTKHYFGICCQHQVGPMCQSFPEPRCTGGTNYIVTFCETSCNFGVTHPWAGITSANNCINAYFANGCMKPTPVSNIWSDVTTCPNCYQLLRPCSSCLDFFNPCTNAYVTALAIYKEECNCRYCMAGHYIACYDIENKCWAEAGVLWDADVVASCMGITNTGAGPHGPICSNCNNGYPGYCANLSSGTSKFSFTEYDDGVFYEFIPDSCTGCAGANYGYVKCFCQPSACNNQLCGYINSVLYKIPYDKKLCDIPGITDEPCFVAMLNYNVDNCLCNYQYQHIYPFWLNASTPKRLNQCTCAYEYFWYSGPTDDSASASQMCQCWVLNCTECVQPQCCQTFLDKCVYTMSTDANCFHSESVFNSNGMILAPGGNTSAGDAYRVLGVSTSHHNYCTQKGAYISATVPNITLCT